MSTKFKINDDPGLTLTFFTSRSILLPLANIWKTSNFERYYDSIMLNKETL